MLSEKCLNHRGLRNNFLKRVTVWSLKAETRFPKRATGSIFRIIVVNDILEASRNCILIFFYKKPATYCDNYKRSYKNTELIFWKPKSNFVRIEVCMHRALLWLFLLATIASTIGILYMSPHTRLFSFS